MVLHAHAKATSSHRSILAPGVQPTPSAHPIECLRVDARDRLCLLVLLHSSPVLPICTAAASRKYLSSSFRRKATSQVSKREFQAFEGTAVELKFVYGLSMARKATQTS